MYAITAKGTAINFTEERFPGLFNWFKSKEKEIYEMYRNDNRSRQYFSEVRTYQVPKEVNVMFKDTFIVSIAVGTTSRVLCKIKRDLKL